MLLSGVDAEPTGSKPPQSPSGCEICTDCVRLPSHCTDRPLHCRSDQLPDSEIFHPLILTCFLRLKFFLAFFFLCFSRKSASLDFRRGIKAFLPKSLSTLFHIKYPRIENTTAPIKLTNKSFIVSKSPISR